MANVLANLAATPTARMTERVKQWSRQSSVPGEYWATFADRGWATLEELATAAEAVRQPDLSAARALEAVR